MSAANRLKVVPWVLGICLGAASLVGANRLLHPTEPTSPGGGDGGKAAKNGGTPLTGGLVVIGSVDSEPSPSLVGPPAVAGMATVKKVLVREGDAVKPGQPLAQFDDAIYRAKLDQATAELAAAEGDVKLAEVAKQTHPVQVEGQRAVVKGYEDQLRFAEESLKLFTDRYNRLNRLTSPATGQTEADLARQRQEDPDLRKVEGTITELRVRLDGERVKLKAMELDTSADLKAQQAADKVKRLQATVREAQAAVDACLVKAEVAGVVEQIAASEGMTFGPGTRSPVMVIVPTGPRVVRAEVEAEFAYKVAGAEGKRVTVYDHSNFALTYEGRVRRVGTAFLPKRGTDAALAVNPTKVLECLIEVPDPAPAGKPPLRVGQPVRVSFP